MTSSQFLADPSRSSFATAALAPRAAATAALLALALVTADAGWRAAAAATARSNEFVAAVAAAVQPASRSAGDSLPERGEAASPGPRRHNVLTWPIYVHWDSDNGNQLRVYGPVSGTWRSDERSAHYLLFPATGWWKMSDGRSEQWLAWPITGRVRVPDRGFSAVHLAGSVLGYVRESNDKIRSLRLDPVYASMRAASGLRQFEIAPAFYRLDDPKASRRVTEFGYVPLLGGQGAALYRNWTSRTGRGWNAALLFGGARTPQSRWLSVPPYLALDRLSGPGSPAHLRAVLPLYMSWQAPDDRWWDFALICGAGRSGSLSWLSLPPYFATTRAAGTDSAQRLHAVVPLYARWQTPTHDIAVALPSFWRYRSERWSTSGVWPLYAWSHRTRADSLERRSGSLAWPLITWGEGDGYSALGLLPLYYKLQDGTTNLTLAPPFFGSYQRPGLDLRVVPGLYLRRYKPADSLEAFALFYRHRGGARRVQGLLGFYESVRSPDVRQDYVTPFFYHRRDRDGEQWLAPGWADWRSFTSGERTRVFGPVVLTSGPKTRGLGVLPVYYTGSGPSGRATILGPLYWSRGVDDSRRIAVIPLAWYQRDRGATELHMLPLTGYGRRADGRSQLYVLWPLYRRQVRADGSRISSLLLWLGRDSQRGERRRTWLQPLVYYDRRSLDSSYLAVLGGVLSSYEHEGSERVFKLFMIPVRRWRN